MKITAIILAALAITAVNAEARSLVRKVEKETIVCKGREESEGITLVLKAKSQSNVEDKAIAYYASITHADGVGYDGMIFGRKSDVQLFLSPRKDDNVQVSGTIYMDDAEQVLTYKVDGEKTKLLLNCGLENE